MARLVFANPRPMNLGLDRLANESGSQSVEEIARVLSIRQGDKLANVSSIPKIARATRSFPDGQLRWNTVHRPGFLVVRSR
jgi:hypothetical protein